MKSYLMLIATLFLAVLINPQISWAQEDPDEITERLTPYTELDTPVVDNPCIPLTRITAKNVLNFQTASMLYMEVEEPSLIFNEGDILISDSESGEAQAYAVEPVEGYWRVQLEVGKDYQIYGSNTCGEQVVIEEVSTKPLEPTALISVGNTLGESLSQWKMSEGNSDLFDYLSAQEGVSVFEKNEFLQNFVSHGTLLSDNYLTAIDLPREAFTETFDPIDPFDPVDPFGSDCECRVLQITATSEIYPTSSSQSDPTIHPAVFPNQIIRETNRIKFWHAGSFEGPARYQQIWGETKKCRNVTERAIWGDNSSDPLASALGRAAIRVEQLCKEGNWTKGECYCTQNLSFEYRYDAQLDARSNERSGWCFNPPGKKAQAIVDDVVIVMVGRRNDPSNPMSTDPIWYDMSAGGAASSCNKDFQEKRFLDVIKLGLAVYAYIKGVPIKIKDPLISSVAGAIWDEYQKSLFFDALTNLLTEPWVTGSCTQVTDNHGIHNSVNLQLDGKDALIFSLTAASYLEVSGMTAWDANARILSGFSTSVVIEKNENVGQDNAYCCTKPAGIYQTSSLHPLHTSNTYKQVIGSHFAPQLSCCFPTSPFTGQVIINHDRNILIGDPVLNCGTTINNRSLESDITMDDKPKYPLGVVYADGNIQAQGLDTKTIYQAELYSLDGKILDREVVWGPGAILFEVSGNLLNAGIYLVKLTGGGQSVTEKLFIP